MTILDALMKCDPSVRRITRRCLLGETAPYVSEGWIGQFLALEDGGKGTWGGGIYGPKWVSTFYTLRDLTSLEIDPHHPAFQRGLRMLVEHMWLDRNRKTNDDCVIAMFISMLVYGGQNPQAVGEMLTCLMSRQLSDGGWNCDADRLLVNDRPRKSSVHTTLSILEAYRDCLSAPGIPIPESMKEQLRVQSAAGREYLLRKRLMRRESDGELIFASISDFHFPERWKYDILRALMYFASIHHPFDPRMSEALKLVKVRFAKGYLGRGSTYSGRLHLKMVTGRLGAMNTLRGLRVLKEYAPETYEQAMSRELPELA